MNVSDQRVEENNQREKRTQTISQTMRELRGKGHTNLEIAKILEIPESSALYAHLTSR